MTSKETKHRKHSKLVRPFKGDFARNEWGIIGAPCGAIQKLALAIAEQLTPAYKVAYIDADHSSAEEAAEQESIYTLNYTDKISFQRLDFRGKLTPFQYRAFFNEQDIVLINGNHFKADRQIVILDPRKEASLQRKTDRLTQVAALLTTPEQSQPYAFLNPHLNDAPTFSIDVINGLVDLIKTTSHALHQDLYGLVLAGGKSMRMGRDKGAIAYHGKPQREYLADLLDAFCSKTFLSSGTESPDFESNYHLLPDTFLGLGPLGGMLSAFREHPDKAWLVVACDLPLLNEATLQQLFEARDRTKVATTFHSEATGFPEPLVTIWEPKSYPILLQFLAQGYSCPRKVLINSEVKVIKVDDANVLSNANTPEEYSRIKKGLDQG